MAPQPVAFAAGVLVSGIAYWNLQRTLEERRHLLVEQLLQGKQGVSFTQTIVDDLYGDLKLAMPKASQVRRHGCPNPNTARYLPHTRLPISFIPQEAADYAKFRESWNSSVQGVKDGFTGLFKREEKKE
uniref:Uncharacterized protein n=1 Tax=Phaeomonas parva TaxID=124430 RepID=A0A7S1UFH4_9STRA|mmetsp:Transcript_44034/g.138382  ORF Transcript_44034/g.138382 Transcript_44034/m.138382 type:complete len:129 (+) Transcript_44034:205-591(+)